MALYSIPFLRNSMVTHLIKITKSTITTTISRSVQKRMAFSITRINAFTLSKERIKKKYYNRRSNLYTFSQYSNSLNNDKEEEIKNKKSYPLKINKYLLKKSRERKK